MNAPMKDRRKIKISHQIPHQIPHQIVIVDGYAQRQPYMSFALNIFAALYAVAMCVAVFVVAKNWGETIGERWYEYNDKSEPTSSIGVCYVNGTHDFECRKLF